MQRAAQGRRASCLNNAAPGVFTLRFVTTVDLLFTYKLLLPSSY